MKQLSDQQQKIARAQDCARQTNSMSIPGLELLRAPFPPNQIGKLPKPTKTQTADLKANFKIGLRCKECGGWHQPEVVHLDYVGHAALTDRLLDTDPAWYWEPLAFKDGLPAFDADGGLWIKLTVCGVTRLGYGNAAESEYKEIGSRQKEVIGDALRNAAMRFGAALELWHKGDLHVEEETKEKKESGDTTHSGKDSPTKAFDAPHKPTGDAFKSLSVDEQTFVFDLSNRVRTLATKGDIKGACDEVDETLREYDNANDLKVALYEKMADMSAVRNAMKKEWATRRLATHTTEVGTQA